MNEELRRKMVNLPFEKKAEMVGLLRRFVKQEKPFKNLLEEMEYDLSIKEMKIKGRKLYLRLEGKLDDEGDPLIVQGEIELSEGDLELINCLCKS